MRRSSAGLAGKAAAGRLRPERGRGGVQVGRGPGARVWLPAAWLRAGAKRAARRVGLSSWAEGRNPGVGRKKRKRTTRFGRDLIRGLQEVVDYLDGKLACKGSYHVRPREVREACGLEPPEMAQRLGMDVDAYLAWEDDMVCVWEGVTFYRPPPVLSPAEQLVELVEAVQAGPRKEGA